MLISERSVSQLFMCIDCFWDTDVHKTFVAVCIASTNRQGVPPISTIIFNLHITQWLMEVLYWLFDNFGKDVCKESTGKYWIPIYNVLENLNILRLSI